MASILELRSRIKSVNSTKKITKAQELIATSRITQAQIRVAASKPYAEEITKVLSPVLKAAVPLSGAARKEMFRFVAVCAGLMEGGLPVAVDWAILLWIIPAIDRSSKNHNAIKALLDEYPLSLSRL